MSYLHSLSVFFTVVENKSFSAAAKQLKLTQPTISFHIDNLEKKLGCPLFVRTAKGVSLTIYGQTLFDNTYKIHEVVNIAENQIKAMVAGSHGQIIIGASTIPGEYMLPKVVAQFLKDHPGLKVSLKAGNSASILSAFANGEFPIAIVGIKPDFDAVPLWHDELILAAHPTLAAELPKHVPLAHICSLPFILREVTSGTRSVLLESLKAQGISADQLNIVLQVGSNEALKSALLTQVGIGFISKWAVQRELAEGRLTSIKLDGLTIERTFYAIHREPLLPTCISLFWEYLKNDQNFSYLGLLP